MLHKTKAERRKARLIQVRQQDKGLAHKVRQDVQCKKLQEQRLLEAHLRANLANCHQKKLKELEVHFLSRVGEFGRGHREAQSMVQVGGGGWDRVTGRGAGIGSQGGPEDGASVWSPMGGGGGGGGGSWVVFDGPGPGARVIQGGEAE